MTPYNWTERPIAFPGVKRFDEIFLKVEPFDVNRNRVLANNVSMNLGDYVCVDNRTPGGGHMSFSAVEVAPMVLAYFMNRVTYINNDRLYFQVYVHGDGTALVILSHGQIIGSHRLAVIDAETIPGQKENCS